MTGSVAVLSSPRPEVVNPSAWKLWGTAVAGAAVVVASLLLAAASDHLVRPVLQVILTNWIVVPYLVSGLIAWWRRPESRLGPLMLATAFLMAGAPLQWSNIPAVTSIGHLFDMLPAALFLHVFLAFPSGRLERPVERAVVFVGYISVVVFQVAKIGLGVVPDSLFVVAVHPALAGLLEGVQLIVVSGLLLTGGVLLVLRRRTTGRPGRRPAALLVDAFGLALVMLAALYVAGITDWAHFEILRHVTFAALGLAPVVFLVALLDARLARAATAGLIVELEADPTKDLQSPLARALHDPTLRLAYWLPEARSWVDQSGKPVDPPRTERRQSVRLIIGDREPIAALLFNRSLEDERELVDAVAAAAGIALENGRLRAELRARLQELQGSRVRVLEAGRQERQRLERNLHDGAQQRLVALSLELSLLGSATTDAAMRERLVRARSEVSASLEELRDVARGIYPAVLSGHGLAVALEALVARFPVPVELDVDVPDRLPEPVEVAAYYVVSESLANLGKHARATSARVRVAVDGAQLLVEVGDDGVGGADAERGSGLRGLADRVEALNGRLRVCTPTGGGTTVSAEIPCQ